MKNVQNNLSFILVALLLISFLIPLTSCSEKKDTLTDGLWLRYKKNEAKYLVAFTKDGKFVDYSDLARVSTFDYRQNRITIEYDYGQKEVYFIEKLTDTELLLSEVMEVGEGKTLELKKPKLHQYFLGKWITVENSPKYLELSFEDDMTGKKEVIVDGFNAKKDIDYKVDGNSLYIDDEKFTFKFDDTYRNLKISSGSDKFNLIRK